LQPDPINQYTYPQNIVDHDIILLIEDSFMRTVEWINGHVRMIDQRQLPWDLTQVEFDDYREVAQAIADMVVRGAPAIGASAAFGMALAAQQCPALDIGNMVDRR
jgi:methylthioribose-1-phosphate isomerase